jgi:DNA-binding NtrC family response regulator
MICALGSKRISAWVYHNAKARERQMYDTALIIVDANEETRQRLCAALEGECFQATSLSSLINLGKSINNTSCRVVIVDLDTLPVDNLFFKEFRRKNPSVCILALSSRSFHPELQEAISKHIYACLAKPVDTEELTFWIRTICEDAADGGNQPAA